MFITVLSSQFNSFKYSLTINLLLVTFYLQKCFIQGHLPEDWLLYVDCPEHEVVGESEEEGEDNARDGKAQRRL